MSLPNELLLDILVFLDYNSVVPAKFVNATFLRLVTQNAEGLARQRHFSVLIQDRYVTYRDDADTARRYIRYDPDVPASFANACQRLATVVRHHIVDLVHFVENTWNRPYILSIFAASAVKYASTLELFTSSNTQLSSRATSEDFFSGFVRLQSLYLDLRFADVDDFHWNVLRLDTFRGLDRLKIRSSSAKLSDNMCDEIARYCSALPQPCDSERRIDMSIGKMQFPATFAKLLLNALTTSDHHVTIQLRTQFPFMLDADELERMGMRDEEVSSNGGVLRRYASDFGGLTVDVDDFYVVMRTTRTPTGGFMPTN